MDLYEFEFTPEAVTFCMPMPSHSLTKNRATKAQSPQAASHLRAIARSHRAAAKNAATSFVNQVPPRGEFEYQCPPFFPDFVEVEVYLRVERAARGQRWDTSGVIEAMKAYLDGFEGLVYANDSSVVYWAPVEWDDKPTWGAGAGRIYITFKRREPEIERGRHFRLSESESAMIHLYLTRAWLELHDNEISSVNTPLHGRRREGRHAIEAVLGLLSERRVIEGGDVDRTILARASGTNQEGADGGTGVVETDRGNPDRPVPRKRATRAGGDRDSGTGDGGGTDG